MGDVEDYQWAAISSATVRLAARLYKEPEIVDGRRWNSIGGPDFSVSGPVGGAVDFGRDVLIALRASRLKRAGGHARAGRYWRTDRFMAAMDWFWSNRPAV